MLARLGVGLRISSVATIVLALWLGFVVATILPAHDPGNVLLWTVVALASLALAVVSLVVTRPGRGHGAPPATSLGVLAVLSIAAIGFGMYVLLTVASDAPAGRSEGYLLIIGAILTVQGALGLTWSGWTWMGARRWSSGPPSGAIR